MVPAETDWGPSRVNRSSFRHIVPSRCSWRGEPFGLTRRFLDVLMELAEATGDLFLIATVLAGIHLLGGIVTKEMLDTYRRRLETMGISDAEFYDLMDDISGGKVTALRGTIESQEGTIKSQEGTIKSLTLTNKSQAEELATARRTAVSGVKALRALGKSKEEISELLELDLSEVNRILKNGRG
jgi:hypothetical protein